MATSSNASAPAPVAAEPMIFESSVAALTQIAKKMKPAGQARLKAAGLDLTQRLLPAYPAKTWYGFVEVLGEELFPGIPREAAHYQVGLAAVESFAVTLQGKAVFGFLRMLGPTRSMARLTWTLKTGANFIETRSTELRKNEFELWMNDVSGSPGFYQGLLERGTHHAGAAAPTVEIIRREPPGCVYRLDLRER